LGIQTALGVIGNVVLLVPPVAALLSDPDSLPAWLPLLAAPEALRLVRQLGGEPVGPWLNTTLAHTARMQAQFGLLLISGLLLAP